MAHLKAAHFQNLLLAGLGLALSLAACQPVTAATHAPAAEPAVTLTSVSIPPAPTAAAAAAEAAATATHAPQATDPPRSVWLAESVPQQLRDALVLPEGWAAATAPEQASLRLDVQPIPAQDPAGTRWVYALAAPFPTVADEISLADVQQAWKGAPPDGLPFTALLVEPATAKAFTALWGPASAVVRVKPAGQLVDAAWAAKTAWAIVPFEQLEPRWKVIAVDGQSPVRKDFNLEQYGLTVRFALQGDPGALAVSAPRPTFPKATGRRTT